MIIKSLIAIAVLASSTQLAAQTPAWYRGKEFVVLRVPQSVLMTGETSAIRLTLSASGKLLVDGDSLWPTRGFPSIARFAIASQSNSQKKNERTFTFKQENRSNGFRFVTEYDEATALRILTALIASPAEYSALFESSFGTMQAAKFTGAAAAIPRDKQRSLITMALAGETPGDISTRVDKGQTQLVFSMGGPDYSYNESKLTPNQIAAKVITDHLLAISRKFGDALLSSPDVNAVVLNTKVAHYNFVVDVCCTRDEWSFTIPRAALLKFTTAEITGQDLVDASVLLINGNRTKVILTD